MFSFDSAGGEKWTLLTLYLGLDVGASGETLDMNQKGWSVV